MPEFKMCPLLSFLPPAYILQHLLENFSKFFIEVGLCSIHNVAVRHDVECMEVAAMVVPGMVQ